MLAPTFKWSIHNVKQIALTLGEPAGIGIDLFLQLSQQMPLHENLPENLKVIADRNLLKHRAAQLKMPFQFSDAQIIHIPAAEIDCCGKPSLKNVPYVLNTLDRAINGCLQDEFAAMVTGPVQKLIINEAGIKFSGHTEYLAEKTGVAKTVMCFENSKLRVALATTHVPLQAVPSLITEDLLIETLQIIHAELTNKFKISHPKIAVCGLNPHAGEAGLLGLEEQTVIIPTLKKLANLGIDCSGPFPADSIFHQGQFDCILSLYHDQLLPALKYADFYETVNITLGLPFVRTSVDHGTALDLAGTGKGNPASLQCAINTAIRLVV